MPAWVAGPIFEKELRVASRHRRNYALRSVYLLVFALILALVSIEASNTYSGSSVYNTAHMSQIGLTISVFIVWFQFIAAHFIAAVLLSTAISDEIYNRTLGVLMTTPINSFQIVTGKLSSRLYQLLLLICLSVPVLAVIRTFGGIPWDFLLSSLAITVCSVLFVACLSLFYSIFCRRAYVAIIITTVTVGCLYVLIPVIVAIGMEAFHIAHSGASERRVVWLLTAVNPVMTLGFASDGAFNPRAGLGMVAPLYVHCLFVLACTAVVFTASVVLVRKAAIRQIAGDSPVSSKRRLLKLPGRAEAPVRAVAGPPVLWKELRTPLFGRRRLWGFIAAAVVGLVLAVTYLLLLIHGNDLRDQDVQMTYMLILGSLGMLFAIAVPAGVITSEKESRSWPLLLATTIGDWSILFGKALGSLRRVLPCFGVLALHVVLFTLVGYIHPACMVLLPVPLVTAVLFLTGTGLYFSTLFKRTTTAVVANFLFAATLWLALPVMTAVFCEVMHISERDLGWVIDLSPVENCIVIMDGASRIGRPPAESFDFIGGRMDVIDAASWIVSVCAGYILLGLVFAWRAKCRFRKRIF
jgi:ABC-type transport system involved in multi-copper enzyme maturation permease subunit